MKTVYLYDAETREFTGTYEAQESPLEPGVFITPEASTDTPPPDFLVGQATCFIDGEWRHVPDVRGIWYSLDGEVVSVDSLLEVISPTYTREPPPLSIQQRFESVRNALQAAIDTKAKELGFSGGDSLIQYVGFENVFQPMAQVFATWEVSVWVEAGIYRDQVIAGTAPMITPEAAVAMMPELVMP